MLDPATQEGDPGGPYQSPASLLEYLSIAIPHLPVSVFPSPSEAYRKKQVAVVSMQET